jgi:hypothetical protein
MKFDFDAIENITTAKTPSIKVINSEPAGLWLANENAELCEWDSTYQNTVPHNIKTDKVNEKGEGILVPGRIILNPRMFILQRSLLLKVQAKTGCILRPWFTKDSKEDNTYACVRK